MTTTSIMPEPRQRYYNNNGTVAAGCYLYTYAAGTSTPKATYTDSAGVTPHSNPIVLDAKGEALIYWDGSYKVDLKTAAGVQITGYPVDNYTSVDALIAASDATLRADLAASTGAGLVGYIESGGGAVGTTAQEVLRESTSVMRYGAVGDGATDDSAAFVLAIKSNRDVYIPYGYTFVLNGATITGQTNFRIHGGGKLLHKAGANLRTSVITITACDDFTVDGCWIDGNMSNLTESSSAQRAYDGLAISASKRFRVINNKIENVFFGAGINLADNGSTTANFETQSICAFNTIKNCGNAVTGVGLCDGIFANSDNTLITGNQIQYVTDTGIAGDYSNNLVVSNNIIRGDSTLTANARTTQGIAILGAQHWQVIGNLVELCQIGIVVTLSGNPAVSPYVSNDVLISNNTVRNISSTLFSGDGITADPSAANITVIGNSLQSVKRGIVATSDNSIIALNRVDTTTATRGIYAGGANTKVLDNIIISAATDGIYVSGTNVEVFGNHISIALANGIDYASSSGRAGWNTFSTISASNEANTGTIVFQGLEAGTWTTVTGSRVAATVYQNTTGKRMRVSVTCLGVANGTLSCSAQVDTVVGMGTAITVDNIGFVENATGGNQWFGNLKFEVPPYQYYRANFNTGTVLAWVEMSE